MQLGIRHRVRSRAPTRRVALHHRTEAPSDPHSQAGPGALLAIRSLLSHYLDLTGGPPPDISGSAPPDSQHCTVRAPCLGTLDGYTTSAPAQRTTPVGSAHRGDTESRTVLQRIARTRSHAARSQPGTSEGNRRSSRRGSSRQSTLAAAVASRTPQSRRWSGARRRRRRAVRQPERMRRRSSASCGQKSPAPTVTHVAASEARRALRQHTVWLRQHTHCTLGGQPGSLVVNPRPS